METKECKVIMAKAKMKIGKYDNISHHISHFNNTVKLLQKTDGKWFSDYQNNRFLPLSIDHIKDYEYLVERSLTNNWTLKIHKENLMSRDMLKRTDVGEMIPYLHTLSARIKI